ncbi:thiosulfate sulfurtransferase rdl2 mitochondrial-related [Holotrichia oblita]|uniref:Thiosulfate sulfurtransferase rdl2 mitochondrial-related n=2 Tax=Holotrichia oblita TaxID=644536 RepID=A0ACB9T0A4_HOLOL|nr:thiosulfate sulfurtransferase rdl2 mitochondrial-related [Holotrichia oblita]KAI4460219.1 thiosulfate sulfurtransferase rdl2 mitochondrial-related [Holotrichia oblita]
MSSVANTVDWTQINKLKDNKEVLLVDVRDPNEIQKTGIIPGAINIPFGTLENALKNVSPEEFLTTYNREKPQIDTMLIFSCGSGHRSTRAENLALNLGYKNVKNYKGGRALTFTIANMSSVANAVDWTQINKLKDNKEVLLVDVREPKEIQESGIIPGAINIPLGTLENALKNVSSEEFLTTYNRQKPQINTPLIFSCRSGNRSSKAETIALNLGYKDVKNYLGGWLDWEKHL